MPRPLDDSLVGTTLGEWKLSRRLGQGAMGVVFEARGQDGTRAAVKVVHPELAQDADFLDRFRREAHTLQRVQHENIVRLLDAGESQGFHYLALEFVEGESIAERLEKDKRGLRADHARTLAIDLLSGLHAVHEQGIVHRDVKPGNILLTRDGVAKLADFGLARRDENVESIQVTQPGMLLGTPHYMAPEQCEGKKVTPRSDLYSAGATLFHALSGAPPFAGKRPMEILVAHMREKPPDLAKKAPDAPPDLVKLVMRLLEKKHDLRPASARDALRWIGVEEAARPARDAARTLVAPVDEELRNAAAEPAAPAPPRQAPPPRSKPSGSYATAEPPSPRRVSER
ncbi:serine/threonine protein kinase, partial [bacterium]|nr:serine/threonine protein kinase [bacterium]